MTRIAYVLKELLRNLYRHFGMTFSSLLSLTLLFVLFDLFWIAAATSDKLYDDLVSEMRMEVFISEDVPDDSISILQNNIAHTDGVVGVSYISKDKAREILRQMLGTDLLVGYDETNPLPRSFILQFTPEYLNTADLAALEQQFSKLPQIINVAYSKNWLAKTEQTRTIIQRFGMALGLFILLTALISTVNSLRLMTRARAIGFRQMRLLGAGRLFLAAPYLMEGFLIGGLSAIIGWLMIWYGKTQISLSQIDIVYPHLQEIVIFCSATTLLGIISGYLGIRKMLR